MPCSGMQDQIASCNVLYMLLKLAKPRQAHKKDLLEKNTHGSWPRESGSEVSSQLAVPGPQWVVVPHNLEGGDYLRIK